ncbi:hypothetical protein MTBGP_02550 [Moorella thermoacetica]|uniref:hypothetical protein n=1 Tax=Neomoorella thermoacetica TaxID=1525 RepID=UPI0030CCEFEA
MFRVKHLRAIALAVTLVFLFSSVAFAAAPKYVYFQSGSDMVKVDYGKAVNDAMNNDNTLYNAVKQYVGAAEETGAPVIVETDDQKVLDYQKALGAGKRFADIVNDPAYQTSKPEEVQKELRVENGQAVIGDIRPEVVEISSITPTDTLGVVEIVAEGTTAEALQAAITPACTVAAKEGVPNTYTVTIQNAAYDQEITLQFAAGFQLKAGVNNKVKWASPPLEVTGVSAVNSKTLKVEFSKAIQDTSAITFSIKRDGNTVVLNPTWSEDKKSVQLISATKLLAGQYVVTVSGAQFAEGKNTGAVNVEAEKVAKIEFIGDKLIKDTSVPDKKASVGYKVLNQYNEDVTKDAIASNINWTASVQVTSLDDDNQGKLTLEKLTVFAQNETIIITGVDPASGTTVTKSFTLGDVPAPASFAFGDVKLPQGATRIYTGQNPAATINVTATDQYGNAIKDTATLNNTVNLISSDSNVSFTFDSDAIGNPIVNVNTSSMTTANKVVLTAVVKATGATTSITLDVVKPAEPASVELGQVSGVIAAGDSPNTLVVPLTVYDQFGNVMSADDVVKNAGSIQVTATGPLAEIVEIATSGDYKGKIVNKAQIPDSTGPATIVVTVPATGKTASINVEIKDKRVISELVAPASLTTNLLQGATSSFAFQVKDQYGELIKSPTNANNNDNLTWKVSISKVSGDDGALLLSQAGDVPIVDNVATGASESALAASNAITVQADRNKTGTANLTAQLLKGTEVVSQVVLTFTVTATSGGLNYSIKDIPVLYKNANASTDPSTDPYAEKVEVIATDASGKTYTINPDDILSITSDNDNINVSGNIVYGDNNPKLDKDVTGTLTVVFNTKDDVKTLTKSVTVSAADLAAQKVYIVDKAIDGTNLKLASGAAEISTVDAVYASGSWSVSQAVYAGVLDQFGRITPADASDKTHAEVTAKVTNIVNLTGVSDNIVNIVRSTGEVMINFSGVDFTAGNTSGSFRVVLTTSNGKVGYFNVQARKQ